MLQYYIFTLILGWKVLLHPFYISLTEIRYNDAEKTIEIAQKIFWDDLERGLGETNKTKVDFLNPNSPEKLEKMIREYVLKHNQITINGKNVSLNYLGYEIEEDATWIYIEGTNVEVPKSVEIINTILIETFGEQQNIINFYVEKKPKSLILYKDKTFGEISF
ncbi:hypothetical protein Belba_0833 [Belliella baltica DSM 15883]|uniref:Uncharacterized protein n=1 Tax=Belliella baltica (strain DSM 15883 / CIP 108006 / LMG 21964 / BA134) TaxID=866536 RepID=I3Z2L2_BELBD|nr:DUF6702 family protein [Belliella baltica]AFL83480.1 hypothetical protein Belba_0833 [Belliella baltica DSM 15883]